MSVFPLTAGHRYRAACDRPKHVLKLFHQIHIKTERLFYLTFLLIIISIATFGE